MAQLYRIPLDINNVNVTSGYIICDDDLADGQSHSWGTWPSLVVPYQEIEALAEFVDDTIGSWWRTLPNYRWDRYGNADQFIIEYLFPIMDNYLTTSAKELDAVYNTSTTLASTVKIDGNIMSSNSLVNIGPTEVRTDLAYSTPLFTSVNLVHRGGYKNGISFSFVVLPTSAVTNGKLTLSTDQWYCTMSVSFTCDQSGTSFSNWYCGVGTSGSGSKVPQAWVDALNGASVSDPDTDPYSGDDSEGDDGGTDNWDDSSDPHPLPDDPELSATDTGFITLFNPTTAQLKSLAQYMWSTNFDLTLFRKLFADPMDCILGLSIVPVAIPSTSGTVAVGNISTGVSMDRATSQYVTVDCGSVPIKEIRKSYLDYAPYCKLSIYLPYCGTFELDLDLFQAKKGVDLGVKYKVDILSGGCTAFVFRDSDVVQEHAGQCAMSIPVSARDFTNTIHSLCTLVASGASFVASGGLSAPVNAAAIAGGVTAAANTAGTVASSKPSIPKSGNMNGSNGMLSFQKPYIILERPKLCAPNYQNKYTGYPSYKTVSLGSLSGFTQVQDVYLNGFSFTDAERDELLALLREGVIL